ncbi:MAG TPA: hypothetical protein DHV36_08385, partial [Desulfobacteraceae bacterium]|nr:hypothetical protein [Desulfobacteraceae bacterium]
MSNGELHIEEIPTQVISAKHARRQNQRWFKNHTTSGTDYLWDLDREPVIHFPRSAPHWWSKDKARKQLSKRRIRHVKFRDDLFPQDPSPDDIRQGAIGSCWWLAAIASVVALPGGPTFIKKMMTATRDHVIVRLFDQRNQPRYIRMKRTIITHTPRRGQPLTLHAEGPKWVAMLEKAATTFTGEQLGERCFFPQDARYMNIHGGLSSEGLKLILGGDVETYDMPSPKEARAFQKARCLFEAPKALFPILEQTNSLAVMWQVPISIPSDNSSSTFLTWKDLFHEVFEESALVDGVTQNQRELNQMVGAMAETFVLMGRKLRLAEKFDEFYQARSHKQVRVRNRIREVRGAFRINDFADFLNGNTGNDRLDVSALGPELCNALLDWATRVKLFPGKRGTGNYSRDQLGLWRRVKGQLTNHLPVCLGTYEIVGSTVDSRGHSAGEDISKGLVGKHAYSVLD